jgi:hypothetical protein
VATGFNCNHLLGDVTGAYYDGVFIACAWPYLFDAEVGGSMWGGRVVSDADVDFHAAYWYAK